MHRYFTSLYSFNYPRALVGILDASGYKTGDYLKALNKTKDFSSADKQKKLKNRSKIKLLKTLLSAGILLQLILGGLLIILGLNRHLAGGGLFGAALIISYPIVWAYLLALFAYIYQTWQRQIRSKS